MNIQYRNNQDKSDPQSRAVFSDGKSLSVLLDGLRIRNPFIAELRGENGFELTVGLGGNLGFVEHRRIDGDLPYLMAVSPRPPMKSGEVEFLTANTPTPIDAKYILTFDELKKIAIEFQSTGERSKSVRWEAI